MADERSAALRRDIARVASLQRELRASLERLDRTLTRLSVQAGSTRGVGPAVPPRRPLRVLVLDVLQDIGLMAYTREVAAYAFSRYDVTIPGSRFGSLAKDEELAYGRREGQRSRNRTLWLTFGLRHDDAAPIRRLLGRSDWPLEDRIWAPTTGRVQHLRLIVKLCEIALATDTIPLANPDTLNSVVAGYARDLPVKTMPDQYTLPEWRDRAQELLQEDDLERRDYEMRLEAAERWSGLSELHQFFGRGAAVAADDTTA